MLARCGGFAVSWPFSSHPASDMPREGFTARAAGIAYRVLFSLAPLAIVLVSVFGLVLQNDELKQDVTDKIVSVLPVDASGSARVEHEISNIASPASAAGRSACSSSCGRRPG